MDATSRTTERDSGTSKGLREAKDRTGAATQEASGTVDRCEREKLLKRTSMPASVEQGHTDGRTMNRTEGQLTGHRGAMTKGLVRISCRGGRKV